VKRRNQRVLEAPVIAVIVAGFVRKEPGAEAGVIKNMLRETATSRLVSIVKNNKNLPIACNGVMPLPGVLSIIRYNCSPNANQATRAVIAPKITMALDD